LDEIGTLVFKHPPFALHVAVVRLERCALSSAAREGVPAELRFV
jgi:hypothetical protein